MPVRPALQCQKCNERNNECADGKMKPVNCPEDASLCYMYVGTRRSFNRGCGTRTDDVWETCLLSNMAKCLQCDYDNCNKQVFLKKSTQYCIKCNKPADCRTKFDLHKCEGLVQLNEVDGCYSKYVEGLVQEKGCMSEVDRLTDFHITCPGFVCNYQGLKSSLPCLTYRGPLSEYRYRVDVCNPTNNSNKYDFPGCYFTPACT